MFFKKIFSDDVLLFNFSEMDLVIHSCTILNHIPCSLQGTFTHFTNTARYPSAVVKQNQEQQQ